MPRRRSNEVEAAWWCCALCATGHIENRYPCIPFVSKVGVYNSSKPMLHISETRESMLTRVYNSQTTLDILLGVYMHRRGVYVLS